MVVEDPLAELREKINNIEVSYDYDGTYNELYDAVNDYCNEVQDWELDSVFVSEDGANYIIDYDYAEEEAKGILENDGLVRLYYWMGDCNFNDNLFYVNGYGNLEALTIERLQELKDEILEAIDEAMYSPE